MKKEILKEISEVIEIDNIQMHESGLYLFGKGNLKTLIEIHDKKQTKKAQDWLSYFLETFNYTYDTLESREEYNKFKDEIINMYWQGFYVRNYDDVNELRKLETLSKKLSDFIEYNQKEFYCYDKTVANAEEDYDFKKCEKQCEKCKNE